MSCQAASFTLLEPRIDQALEPVAIVRVPVGPFGIGRMPTFWSPMPCCTLAVKKKAWISMATLPVVIGLGCPCSDDGVGATLDFSIVSTTHCAAWIAFGSVP